MTSQDKSYNFDFFSIAFSVDNVIFGFDSSEIKVLLIKRSFDPFKDMWALPGDLVLPDEDLRNAPKRVLKELTGLDNVYLEQVKTFGKVNRHPRGRVVTVAYYSLININEVNPVADSFAQEVEWHPLSSIQELAFDHLEIMNTCLARLQSQVKLQPIGFELLPEKFTLSELQDLYEAILNKKLDKRNFRKKIMSLKVLKDNHEYQQGVAHRPAKLYAFDKEKFETIKSEGIHFEI